MDKLKQWVALTVVGMLAILAAGWFLLVSPKRSEAHDLTAQVATQQGANGQLQTKLAMLKAQAKALPAQQATLARVAAKIPDNPALPTLIRALDAAATAAGVELISMAPAAPAAFASTSSAGAPAAPAAPAPGSAASSSGGLAPHSVAASGTGLEQISLTLNVVGGYFQVEQFLDGLENLTRAMKVTGLMLAPGDNPMKVAAPGAVSGPSAADTGKSLNATISGQVYMTTAAAPAAAIVPIPSK